MGGGKKKHLFSKKAIWSCGQYSMYCQWKDMTHNISRPMETITWNIFAEIWGMQILMFTSSYTGLGVSNLLSAIVGWYLCKMRIAKQKTTSYCKPNINPYKDFKQIIVSCKPSFTYIYFKEKCFKILNSTVWPKHCISLCKILK